MVKNILRKSYFKTTFLCLVVIALSITTTILTHNYNNLVFGFLLLAFLIGKSVMLSYNVKKGKCVVIYAQCVEEMRKTGIFGNIKEKDITYRFITEREESIVSEDGEQYASIFLEGENGKFHEHESYCLLFQKNISNEYNTLNLIGYDVIQANIVTQSADEVEREKI